MTSRLNPYVSFNGNTREAMEFYQSVLGGELAMHTFGEYGQEPSDGIMHAQLETPLGFCLMAADVPEGMDYNAGDNISISLSGDDAEALRGYFAQLSEGAQITLPLEVQAWGDEFGMLIDRYGNPWMVNIVEQAK